MVVCSPIIPAMAEADGRLSGDAELASGDRELAPPPPGGSQPGGEARPTGEGRLGGEGAAAAAGEARAGGETEEGGEGKGGGEAAAVAAVGGAARLGEGVDGAAVALAPCSSSPSANSHVAPGEG